MIRNELGIRVVPHIIVRASMQIACCSLSRRREKLSTKSTKYIIYDTYYMIISVVLYIAQHANCLILIIKAEGKVEYKVYTVAE